MAFLVGIDSDAFAAGLGLAFVVAFLIFGLVIGVSIFRRLVSEAGD